MIRALLDSPKVSPAVIAVSPPDAWLLGGSDAAILRPSTPDVAGAVRFVVSPVAGDAPEADEDAFEDFDEEDFDYEFDDDFEEEYDDEYEFGEDADEPTPIGDDDGEIDPDLDEFDDEGGPIEPDPAD